MNELRRRRAFTLIELMIVVAIIGILASIAVPNFVKFSCRAKQSEAKSGLKVLLVAEDTYRATNDTYLGGTEAAKMLDRMLTGRIQRYDYSIAAITVPNEFTAQARPYSQYNGEMKNDTWQTNQIGGLVNINPGCQ